MGNEISSRLSGKLSKITDSVYLSNQRGARDLKKLRKHKIRNVLTIARQRLYRRGKIPPGILYKHIRAGDPQDILACGILQQALNFIQRAERAGQRILVHCAFGISRSPTIVCAHLMARRRWSYAKALHYVKSRRSVVKPKKAFKVQLEVFARSGYLTQPEEIVRSRAYINAIPKLRRCGIHVAIAM